jgi:hypothetical protein
LVAISRTRLRQRRSRVADNLQCRDHADDHKDYAVAWSGSHYNPQEKLLVGVMQTMTDWPSSIGARRG